MAAVLAAGFFAAVFAAGFFGAALAVGFLAAGFLALAALAAGLAAGFFFSAILKESPDFLTFSRHFFHGEPSQAVIQHSGFFYKLGFKIIIKIHQKYRKANQEGIRNENIP